MASLLFSSRRNPSVSGVLDKQRTPSLLGATSLGSSSDFWRPRDALRAIQDLGTTFHIAEVHHFIQFPHAPHIKRAERRSDFLP
jgi:hypothetical protein